MADLDDAAAMSSIDRSGMLGTVAALPAHCREGYRLGGQTRELPDGENVAAIAFCGMGGSAVAGDVIRALFRHRLRTPIASVNTRPLASSTVFSCGARAAVNSDDGDEGSEEDMASQADEKNSVAESATRCGLAPG